AQLVAVPPYHDLDPPVSQIAPLCRLGAVCGADAVVARAHEEAAEAAIGVAHDEGVPGAVDGAGGAVVRRSLKSAIDSFDVSARSIGRGGIFRRLRTGCEDQRQPRA